MGVNNKQRRAAKRKKAQTRNRSGGPSHQPPWFFQEPVLTPDDVRSLLLDVVARIWDDRTAAARCAELLLAPGRPLTPDIARAGVRSLLSSLVRTVTTNGWSPSDLVQITVRLASAEHVPLLLGLLADDASRRPADQVSPAWAHDLRSAGPAVPLALTTAGGMQQALEIAASLAQLPAVPSVLPGPGTGAGAAPVPGRDRKLLARVQALLAKAEATEFDEEAEALSAKAQQLVSRHALERLLDEADTGPRDERPLARRLWLDAPYVFPKAMLVHVVATANRCRSVVSEKLGFCTLVGHRQDLDAVELLVPSLLVQAHTAMGRFGRQADRSGTSRTRSFRQSFLLAYANRIGERLQAADGDAAQSSGRAGELVPLLERHRKQVDDACDGMFPHLVEKAGSIGNAAGWAAGRSAADEALLGADLAVTEAARAAS